MPDGNERNSGDPTGHDLTGHDLTGHDLTGHDVTENEVEMMGLLQMIISETGTVDALDTVPPSVNEGSIWVHDWHMADAELAVLESDTLLRPLAGVRGPSAVRDIIVSAEGVECELDVSLEADGYVVAGRLLPSRAVDVTLCVAGIIRSASSDTYGRFELRALPGGTALGFLHVGDRSVRIPPFVLGAR
jgi:hypothetical protein